MVLDVIRAIAQASVSLGHVSHQQVLDQTLGISVNKEIQTNK